MSDRRIDDDYIKELLRQTGEQAAPAWMKREIMQRVDTCRPCLYNRLKNWIFQPTLNFSPIGLVLMAVIVCTAFWGGVLLERQTIHTAGRQAIETTSLTNNAKANYLIGRGLLAADQREAALTFLHKAVELDPESTEYVHWQGVANWSTGNMELERQSYFKIVKDHPDYVPSLLNLGHSFLENGNYSKALDYYQQVLQHEPQLPEALYNSALAYQKLDDKDQEKIAFQNFLKSHRTGKWAFRAVDHLHQLGDFSFRTYRIGIHYLILNMSDLVQPDPGAGQKEVQLLANVFNRAAGQELQIVAYDSQMPGRAKQTALNLRDQLLRQLGPTYQGSIKVSWFDTAEAISFDNGRNLQVSPSVLIFSTPINMEKRRKSI
jgi:tetratricopeptide (TPR) repeat protein